MVFVLIYCLIYFPIVDYLKNYLELRTRFRAVYISCFSSAL